MSIPVPQVHALPGAFRLSPEALGVRLHLVGLTSLVGILLGTPGVAIG